MTDSPLAGTWQMVRAERSGDPAPELVTRHITLELTAETYLVRHAGQVTDQGTFATGAVVGRRTMVWHGTAGHNAGRTIPCLYQLRGDRLRICYGLNGVAPTEFATTIGDQRYLATYRRI